MKKILKEYNFSDKEINEYLSTYSFDRTKNDTLRNNFISCYNYLIKLKYSPDDAITIIKKCPEITSYTKLTLDNKLNNIKNLGYSISQVLSMIKNFPTMLTYNENNINQKVEDLTFLLVDRKKVLQILLKKTKFI